MANFGRKSTRLKRMTQDEIANSMPTKAAQPKDEQGLAQPDSADAVDKNRSMVSASVEVADGLQGKSLATLEHELSELMKSRGRGRPSAAFKAKLDSYETRINQLRFERDGENYLPAQEDETITHKRPAGASGKRGRKKRAERNAEQSQTSDKGLEPTKQSSPRSRSRSVESFLGPKSKQLVESAEAEQRALNQDEQSSVDRGARLERKEAVDRGERGARVDKPERSEKTERSFRRPDDQQSKRHPGRPRRQEAERRPHEERESSRDHTRESSQIDRVAERQDRSSKRNTKRYQEQEPSCSKEDLASLETDALVELALGLGLDVGSYREQEEFIKAIYLATIQKEGFMPVKGILDILPEGFGFIRTRGYLPTEDDVYVAAPFIKKRGLRKGDVLEGISRPRQSSDKYPALFELEYVNGKVPEDLKKRPRFGDLTPIYPDERLVQEHGKTSYTGRCIDLVAPIGKGQRGLIVSPPKAGKTTILKKIAESVSANNPEVHLMCLLVDERPEEVTDMTRSIKGEVIASTFDMPCDQHIAVAELVIERAKRLVELGEDVVILLDSITRLARAYNLAQPASGRILSGGVDSTALYPPKRFLGAARNIEGGGSLTILASALIDTGSKMDEVIFEEFKGTGNMELKLDRELADRRIFPAIDPVASGTRQEDILIDPAQLPFIWGIRRILANYNNIERAMTILLKSLTSTETNDEFLMRSAKKSQGLDAPAEL